MEVKETTVKTTGAQSTTQIKRTLNLTSLTVNAMALIAPGAFLWTTFQMQAAQVNGAVSTAGEMWTGLVAALVLAFLTAISYAELSDIYPKAGSGSSYYFAEAALLEKEKSSHRQYSRIAKFGIGWISHLYYWIYPGIMVAFSATLIVYIFGLFGVKLNVPAEILVAAAFAIINGYIAFRGVTGSTITSVAINAIQLVSLMLFSILAIVYRVAHPGLAYAATVPSILLPHNFSNVIFQSTIAILLLVGFESVTAFGSEAINPKKDIRKAILLSLIIQGVFAYLFEYFAANYFVSTQLDRDHRRWRHGHRVCGGRRFRSPHRRHDTANRRQNARRDRAGAGAGNGFHRSLSTNRHHPGLFEHRRAHYLRHEQRQRTAFNIRIAARTFRHTAMGHLDSGSGFGGFRGLRSAECG